MRGARATRLALFRASVRAAGGGVLSGQRVGTYTAVTGPWYQRKGAPAALDRSSRGFRSSGWLAAGALQLLPQEFRRIDPGVIYHHFVMEMWTRRPAGHAHRADHLSTLNLLAR